MPKQQLAIEWKFTHATRKNVDEMAGIMYRKGIVRGFIYCKSATKEAYDAADDYANKGLQISIVAKLGTDYEPTGEPKF